MYYIIKTNIFFKYEKYKYIPLILTSISIVVFFRAKLLCDCFYSTKMQMERKIWLFPEKLPFFF